MKNQDIYATHGIQASDTKAIALKLGFSEPYSSERVDRIVSVKNSQKASGMNLSKYLELMGEAPATSSSVDPIEPSATSSSVDPMEAAKDMQMGLAVASDAIARNGQEFYSNLDRFCSGGERELTDLLVGRVNEFPARVAASFASQLKAVNPAFFPLAPTGANLPQFNFHGCGTSILTGGASECGSRTIEVVAEDDQRAEQ